VTRALAQVDVFATAPYSGNPVAVVLDGEGLRSEQMQRFAHWTNLSETTFVLPARDPQADYRLRIFTPTEELPFAGHPTLGSAHAWLRAGGAPAREGVVVQECEAGLIEVRSTAEGLAFAAPPLVRGGPAEERLAAEIAAAMGLERGQIVAAQWVDNGPGWVAALLADAETVLSARPAFSERAIGLVGPHPPGAREAFEVRAFFAKDGAMVEDPVTGSLNASLAQWLLASARASAPYVVRQGTALGRAGRVYVSQAEDGGIWVGGATVTRIEGEVDL
jgi:PhzF family phenazine biosynthesis protein